MPVVISRKQVEDFTPESYAGAADAPSYRIAPLTLLERADYYAAVGRAGAVFRTDADVRRAMRAALTDLAPDNLADLLATLDQADDLPVQVPVEPKGKAGAPPDADALREYTEAMAERDRINAALLPIEEAVSGDPRVATVKSERGRFFRLSPMFAAAYALRGWTGIEEEDGQPVRFVRKDGRVPDDLLSLLPESDVTAIGLRAIGLMQPGPSDRKN